MTVSQQIIRRKTMKKFTRILAFVIAAAFVASMAIVGVSAASTAATWYTAAVEYLDDAGISNIGSTAGDPVTRDEFVTWVAKIESRQTIETAWSAWEYTANMTFNDVSESNHLGAIGYSVNRKFIVGNGDIDADGRSSFAPDATTKLAEAAAVIVRMMGYSSLVKADEDWAVNNMNVAQRYFSLFDATFLAETVTYDPWYELTKGEAAYLLYTIMNGKVHDGTDPYATPVVTIEGIDLGEYFANLGSATISYKVMVTELTYSYGHQYDTTDVVLGAGSTLNPTGRVYRRLDASGVGSNYGTAMNHARTFGWINNTAPVVLTSVDGKALTPTGDTSITLTGTEFYNLVNLAAGNWKNGAVKDDTINITNYVNKGSVLTLKVDKTSAGNVTYNSIKTAEIIDSLIIDTSTRLTASAATTYVPYLYVGKASAANYKYSRSVDTYTWKDVSNKGGKLTVNGVDYNVVTAPTGNKTDLMVYTLAGVTTDVQTVSVVGDKGDRIFAGATLEQAQYDTLIAADPSYAAYFTAGTTTVATTFALKEDVANRLSFNMNTKGGLAFSVSLALMTSFLDRTTGKYQAAVDYAHPLSASQAQNIMLDKNYGECTTVFTDIDKDGYFDTAVVIEATTFLFYQDINYSVDPGNGFIGYVPSSEVYDAFGNYVTTSYGTKGVNVGGFSIGKNIVTGQYEFGQCSGLSTDLWKVDGSNSKIQLVFVPSNLRQGYQAGLQNQYGSGSAPGYQVVDIATLTTGYITKVNTATKTVAGQVCYEATIVTTDGASAVVYVPVNPSEVRDVAVTMDGYTSTIKTHSGKQFMSFVTDHQEDDSLGDTAQLAGTWMAGHTVMYVVDEHNVAWAMVETAKRDAVEGFVTAISKSTTGDNAYSVTVATTKDLAATLVRTPVTVAMAKASWYLDCENGTALLTGYGMAGMLDPTLEVKVYVANTAVPKSGFLTTGTSQDQGHFETVTGLDIPGSTAAPIKYIFSWSLTELTGATPLPVGATINKLAYDFYVRDAYKSCFTEVKVPAWKLWTAANINKTIYVFDAGETAQEDLTLFSFATGDTANQIRNGLSNITFTVASGAPIPQPGYVIKGTDVYTTPYTEATLDVAWFSAYYYVYMNKLATTSTDTFTLNDYAAAAVVPSTGDTYDSIVAAHDVLVESDYVCPALYVYHRTVGTSFDEYVKITSSVDTLKTVTVRGSGTSVWTYDAATYKFVHELLTEQKLYNTATWTTAGKVTASDLLYVTLGTDASGYYTIEGKDAKAYTDWTLVGDELDTAAFCIATGGNGNNAWRYVCGYVGVIARDYKQGATQTWITGNATKALGSAIIDGSYTKTSTTSTVLPDGNGFTDTFKMAVGKNPYYLRTIDAKGLVTIEKYYGEVTLYENVVGTKYYQIDRSKTIVIELYTAESDGSAKKQVVDDGVSYSDNSKYWVDSTGLVYKIDSTAGIVYDTTKTTSSEYVYDISNATPIQSYTDVKMGDTVSGVKCGTQQGYTVATFTNMSENAVGYVPTMVNVSIATNLSAADAFTMMGSSMIVIATPTASGMTYTSTTAKALADKGTTLYVTSYDRIAGGNSTFLVVIGEAYQSTVTPVTPAGKESTVIGGKLVYLPANAGFYGGVDQFDNYWVVRSTGSAYDVTTGAEIGSIQKVFNTYVEKDQTVAGGGLLGNAGEGAFFLVDENNTIITTVDFTTPGTTTVGAASVTVKQATITNCGANGSLTATVDGKKGVDLTGKTFKFFYSTLDGNSAGLAGSSTKVSILTVAEIEGQYAAYEAIANDTTKSAEDRAEAAAKVAEIQAQATGSYLNGQFWGVEYSPLYNYFQSSLITYQTASAVLNYNYVIVDDVVYVYVNTFAY